MKTQTSKFPKQTQEAFCKTNLKSKCFLPARHHTKLLQLLSFLSTFPCCSIARSPCTMLAPQIAAPSCGEDHSRALDKVHVRTFPWWSGEFNPSLNYLRRAPSASCLRSLREGCTNKSGRAPVGLGLPRGRSMNRMTSSGVFQPFLLGALSSLHFIFKAPFEHCLPDASNTLLLLSLLPGTAFDFSPKELRGQGERGLDGHLQHTAP